MENLRSLLPSVNSLVVFEAAGRLSSFTGAARELRMTQAAVSYAVHRLEAHLGTALFLREQPRHLRVQGAVSGEARQRLLQRQHRRLLGRRRNAAHRHPQGFQRGRARARVAQHGGDQRARRQSRAKSPVAKQRRPDQRVDMVDPRRPEQHRLAEGAELIARHTSADLVVFGHAHHAEVRGSYANPGSFAFSEGDGRTFLELDTRGGRPRAELRSMPKGGMPLRTR